MQEVGSLDKTLGPGDRTQAERISRVGSRNRTAYSKRGDARNSVDRTARTARPTFPPGFEEHIKLMYDLQVLGFQADVTRVFTMMVCRELSARTYPQIGVPDQHHPDVASPERSRADREEGEDRHVSCPVAGIFSGEAAGHAGWRRHAARPEHDSLRRRHGRRQPAPAFQSALPDGRETGRAIRDRTASGLSSWIRRCRTCC